MPKAFDRRTLGQYAPLLALGVIVAWFRISAVTEPHLVVYRDPRAPDDNMEVMTQEAANEMALAENEDGWRGIELVREGRSALFIIKRQTGPNDDWRSEGNEMQHEYAPRTNRKRRISLPSVGIGFLIIFAVYVVVYFLVPRREYIKGEPGRNIIFKSVKIARLYVPAVWLEAKITGYTRLLEVRLTGRQDPATYHYRVDP